MHDDQALAKNFPRSVARRQVAASGGEVAAEEHDEPGESREPRPNAAPRGRPGRQLEGRAPDSLAKLPRSVGRSTYDAFAVRASTSRSRSGWRRKIVPGTGWPDPVSKCARGRPDRETASAAPRAECPRSEPSRDRARARRGPARGRASAGGSRETGCCTGSWIRWIPGRTGSSATARPASASGEQDRDGAPRAAGAGPGETDAEQREERSLNALLRLGADKERGAEKVREKPDALQPSAPDRAGRYAGGQQQKEKRGRLRIDGVERRRVADVGEEEDQQGGNHDLHGDRKVPAGAHEKTQGGQEQQHVDGREKSHVEGRRGRQGPVRCHGDLDQERLAGR